MGSIIEKMFQPPWLRITKRKKEEEIMRRIFIFCLLWGFAAFASQFGLVTSAEAYCVTNSRDSDRTLYFYTPSHQGDFEKQVAPGKKECCKSGSSGCLAGANDKSIATFV